MVSYILDHTGMALGSMVGPDILRPLSVVLIVVLIGSSTKGLIIHANSSWHASRAIGPVVFGFGIECRGMVYFNGFVNSRASCTQPPVPCLLSHE